MMASNTEHWGTCRREEGDLVTSGKIRDSEDGEAAADKVNHRADKQGGRDIVKV
jgi:hypothetical protein